MNKLLLQDVLLENDEQNLVSVHFNSITDLMSFDENQLEKEEHQKKFRELLKDKGKSYRSSDWYGFTNESCADVVNHALLGDEVLLKSLDEKIKLLDKATGKNTTAYKQNISVVKRKSFWDKEGDELCLDKLYAGELDTAWRTTKRIVIGQEQKLVTLFINIGGMARVNVEDSFWRSAVAVKICNELESTGKQVKIVVGSGTDDLFFGYKKFTGSIVVKQYNERLTMSRLCAMSHVGFHRTFGFAVKCCTNYKSNLDSMGRTVEVNANRIPLHIQNEINSGKSRFVFVEPALNQSAALRSLESCYQQLKDLSAAA